MAIFEKGIAMGPRRVGASLLVSLLMLLTVAWPHAYLIKSAPARRAVLFRAPQRVRLWFNERLEAQFSLL